MSNALAKFLSGQVPVLPNGNQLPVNYGSVMGGMSRMLGGAAPSNISSYGGAGTGSGDFLGGMQPNLAGVDLSEVDMGAPGGSGWGSGIQSWLKDNGVIGSMDIDGLKTDGWGSMALGAASGLMSGFLGMKQYGIAKDSLAQGKKEFDLNFGAQQKTTNAQLEDRQRARVASNPGAYQSVSDYMKKNGI